MYLRAICDTSFYEFIKICGGPVRQGGIITPEIHLPLCDFSQDPTIKRRAIGMPRDWLKSTCFTKWKAIYTYLQDPEERQLIASENERIAMNMNLWIQRQILNNETLRSLYWDILHGVDTAWTRSHRWSGTVTELPRVGTYSEPSIQAIGVGGAAQSGHYTTIKIDDLVGQDAMDSPLVMEKVFRWFDNVNELLVHPDWTHPEASTVEIVGTHWSTGDYFHYVQQKYKEYEWRMVPARKDMGLKGEPHITWIQNPNVENAESNWPERFPTDYYVKMLNNPEKQIIYWSQHQNNPSKASGLNKFQVSWLKKFKFDKRDEGLYVVCDDDKEVFKVSEMPLIGMIDPGGFAELKMMKKGSRNAMLIGGQPRETIKKFVVWIHTDRFQSPKKFMDILFDAEEEYSPRVWRIDHAGQQDYILSDIMQERTDRGIPLQISPLDVDTRRDSKDTDIQSLIAPIFSLIEEIGSYPHGLTKDLIDLLGKLYVNYWHRKPAEDIEKRLAESQEEWKKKRSRSRTGY